MDFFTLGVKWEKKTTLIVWDKSRGVGDNLDNIRLISNSVI